MLPTKDNINLQKPRISESLLDKESYEAKSVKQTTSIGTHVTNITNITNNYNVSFASNETPKGDFTYNFPKFKGSVSYIEEAEKARIIQEYLVELKDVLDNPLDFEQISASIISILNDLESRKKRREVYFSDLLLMIRQALMNSDADSMSPDGINVLHVSVEGLPKELTNNDLKLCRSNFRKASLNILPKLKWEVDFNKLKEFFDETAD